MRIQVLDEQLTNQIAAGEVVERPASVVKELVENSLDAGSTQITIEIDQGGHQLIRIRDNGAGIHPEDLPLALNRHATSKIKTYADLEAVVSLGFRGEALASIAAVSRLKLASCHHEVQSGFCVLNNDEKNIRNPAPIAHPQGTTVEVRDLFYNTPARRKFLRTPATEFDHIEGMIYRLALSHFNVGFTLKHNQKEIFHCRPADAIAQKEQRIAAILGQEFLNNAIAIEFAAAGLKLLGWIALPVFTRSQADMQYCYLNGRFVRDKLIMHAVKQAYQDVLFNGRHPAYVLYLEINPAQVDVNVHPTKHEVRFRDSRVVHDFVMRGIHDALEQVRPGHDDIDALPVSAEGSVKEPVAQGLEKIISHGSHSTETYVPPIISSRPAQQSFSYNVQEQIEHYGKLHPEQEVHDHDQEYPLGFAIGQLHEIYILAENKDGLVMVDMHAAHERVLYEKLKQQLAQNEINVQPLLVPISIHLSPQELKNWEGYQEVFTRLGIETEQAGPLSVMIRSVPVLIKDREIAQLIRDVLSDIAVYDDSKRIEERVNETLATVACHASIRAHHKLTILEMNALLRQMETTKHAGQCNHGRPTYKKFNLSELDKMFLRGQ